MNLQMVNNKMEALMNERLKLQRAYSAANSLMHQLNIPEGDHLVFVLNQTKAKSNKDAICSWLLEQNNSQMIDGRQYAKLKDQLKLALVDSTMGDY